MACSRGSMIVYRFCCTTITHWYVSIFVVVLSSVRNNPRHSLDGCFCRGIGSFTSQTKWLPIGSASFEIGLIVVFVKRAHMEEAQLNPADIQLSYRLIGGVVFGIPRLACGK